MAREDKSTIYLIRILAEAEEGVIKTNETRRGEHGSQ